MERTRALFWFCCEVRVGCVHTHAHAHTGLTSWIYACLMGSSPFQLFLWMLKWSRLWAVGASAGGS